MIAKHTLVRNLDGDIYRENFFVAAIVSMLAIRFYLYITGYPQIGGHGLHIAHMLWGGFLMMLCLMLIFTFLNRGTMQLASILGGIGFGTFIDELGKFITSNNNYFFQPTIAIIYIIFVLLFLGMKAIGNNPPVSKQEYLVNAMQLTQDAVLNDLDKDEEKRALAYLKKADRQNPITKAMRTLLHEVEAIPTPKPRFVTRIYRKCKSVYHSVANWRKIMSIVITIFILNVLAVVIGIADVFIEHPTLTFAEWGQLVSSVLSGVFVVAGLIIFRHNRVRGYNYFKVALLIDIFLTQVFIFYQEQLQALVGLFINLFILAVLNFAIEREKEKAAAVLLEQPTIAS